MIKHNRIEIRNEKVRRFFSELEQKYPQWRISALEEKTADHFFISERTVRAILKGVGIYSENFNHNK